jgi:hypothetical protein
MNQIRRILVAAVMLAGQAALAANFNIDVQSNCTLPHHGIRFTLDPHTFISIPTPGHYDTYMTVNGSTGNWTVPEAVTNQDPSDTGPVQVWLTSTVGSDKINPGDWVHAGFSTTPATMTVHCTMLEWMDLNGIVTDGCKPMISKCQIHVSGKQIYFDYDNAFTSTVVFEYYADHQELATLNSTTKRSPMTIQQVREPKTAASFDLPLNPPAGAKYIVADVSLKNPADGQTARYWAEFPLDQESGSQWWTRWWIWALGIVVLILFATLARRIAK